MITPFLALVLATDQPLFCHDVAALTRAAPCSAPAPVTANVCDILSYDLQIELFLSTQQIAGTTAITFTSAGGTVTQVPLQLRQLDVGSVWDLTGSLSFSHVGDSLVVSLTDPVTPGVNRTIFVQYSGTPWNEGPGKFGGFWFHPYVSYQMGVGVYSASPSMGRCMFPCWDHPSDKATFEFHVTVDDTVEVVANGAFQGVNFSGGKATWSWLLSQPMSTYLAALSASEYVDLVDSTYSWIHYYVYPNEISDAQGSFQNVNFMMDELVSRFGPYPWTGSKFSYVETPKGDMEHTTEVYHLQSLINGQTNNDPILAHEMGHMWWGNCVTEADWNDVWLSEGFGTYSEAIWAEHYGAEAYDQYMVSEIMIPYLQSGEVFPMGAPEELWSYTTYQKGASVLHMLRHVVGEGAFFAGLGAYFADHQFALAETTDLREHMEVAWGQPLDWFFDEWVYGFGYPVYDIGWSKLQSGSDWNVTITVDQVQGTGTLFTMPLEFDIRGPGGSDLVVMWNDQQGDSHTYTVGFEPSSVEFDPGHYVLSTALLGIPDQPSPPPGGTGVIRLWPNPCIGQVNVLWPGMEGSQIRATLFDLSGRSVAAQTLEPGAGIFTLGDLPGGTYLLEVRAPGNLRQVASICIPGNR
jgi:aminopeptidase N